MIADKAGEPSWLPARERQVQRAVDQGDVDALARLAALPGGFGSDAMRRKAWYALLRVAEPHVDEKSATDSEADADDGGAEHPDEHQVLLDTRRSFVTFPKGLPADRKKAMQADLQRAIVAVLRRHPRLRYFQGYHDIVTVLYLTLLDRVPAPAEPSAHDAAQWDAFVRCAEAVSLSRVRDGMGKGLEPMMGLLKILRRLLRLADPQLYRVSASISPIPTLPFFALSWILTLFSHDVDSLEPIQRIFDYLVGRNPIAAIYLAVAIIVAKKPQMVKLVKALGAEAAQDPSLLHPLFARLPPLYPDTPSAPSAPVVPPAAPADGDAYDEPNPYAPIRLSDVFALSDKLLAKYPWDGPLVRGREVMGPGSVVLTYPDDPAAAEAWVDRDVVMPGAERLDDDDDDVPARRRWQRLPRLPRMRAPPNKLGTAVAVGVLVLGLGLAVAGAKDDGWRRWWAGVVRGSAGRGKLADSLAEWARVGRFFVKSLADIV